MYLKKLDTTASDGDSKSSIDSTAVVGRKNSAKIIKLQIQPFLEIETSSQVGNFEG